MQVQFALVNCRDKVSPQCEKTFSRKIQRGRPALNCTACRAVNVPTVASGNAPATPAITERECPCGVKFHTKPGRGRKPSKCEACRASGTVYRSNDDGLMEAIQQDQLAREAREAKEAAGLVRAMNLTERMQSLMKRRGIV